MENIVLYLLRGSLVMSKCKQSKLLSKKKTKMNIFYPTIGYFPSHSEAIAGFFTQFHLSYVTIYYICIFFI